MEPNLKYGGFEASYRASAFIGCATSTKDKLFQDVCTQALKKK